MFKNLAGIGLRGKRAAEHEDDEDDAKAEDESAEALASEDAAAEDDEDAEAKAQEEDDEDNENDEDDEESASKKDARGLAAKADRKAERKMRVYARKVKETCELARAPELAGGFIAKGMSLPEVRRTILERRASASSTPEIAGHKGPDDSPGAVAAMWDHAIDKNTRVGTAGVNRKVA